MGWVLYCKRGGSDFGVISRFGSLRIKKGSGVCGVAWLTQKTQVVSDVDAFPGHIACSSNAKSEIVVPAIRGGKPEFVLDVDSSMLNEFIGLPV